MFNSADVDNNKSLNFIETMKLIRELNIQMSDSQAKKLFDEANTRKAGKRELEVLDEDEFIAFYFKLLHRPEIDKLFSRFSQFTFKLSFIVNSTIHVLIEVNLYDL